MTLFLRLGNNPFLLCYHNVLCEVFVNQGEIIMKEIVISMTV